jgi:hypothetical protein
MPKTQRVHREWFRPVSLGNRKSCPTCGEMLGKGSIISWGEYQYGKWRTVKHFCRKCYKTEVKPLLEEHAAECGCTFELMNAPEWLKISKKYTCGAK